MEHGLWYNGTENKNSTGTIDGTFNNVVINVTGVAGLTIDWAARATVVSAP